VEETTGLRPTNEKILKGFKTLGIPLRLRDHTRCMVTGMIKCGAYWNNIPGYCRLGTLLVLQKEKRFRNYGERTTYVARMRKQWSRPGLGNSEAHLAETTSRTWPNISTGLIKGITALSFEDDLSKDSERLRILISMTIWAI